MVPVLDVHEALLPPQGFGEADVLSPAASPQPRRVVGGRPGDEEELHDRDPVQDGPRAVLLHVLDLLHRLALEDHEELLPRPVLVGALDGDRWELPVVDVVVDVPVRLAHGGLKVAADAELHARPLQLVEVRASLADHAEGGHARRVEFGEGVAPHEEVPVEVLDQAAHHE